MTFEQALVFGVILLVLGLFVWGRWRYDVVAILGLLVLSLAGIVPGQDAFAGFGHPAVTSVAAVLVVSQGLQASGFVDALVSRMERLRGGVTIQVGALSLLVALFSAFMNNVGALAVMMPVAIRVAGRSRISPSVLLMPLAFASLLGGMTTMIGTPPNLIIATFRAQNLGRSFGMFDFSPVGAAVAAAGILFISLVGWRLIPRRREASDVDELFRVEDYVTEMRATPESPLVGRSLRELPGLVHADLLVIGLVRQGNYEPALSGYEIIRPEDVLIVEADDTTLAALVEQGLELAEAKQIQSTDLDSAQGVIVEVILRPGSPLQYRTAIKADLRRRFGVNLLAVSRAGARLRKQVGKILLRPGDILLLQARKDALSETLAELGCLPLAERNFKLQQSPRKAVLAFGLFAAALLATALDLLPVQVALASAAAAMLLTGVLELKDAYQGIEWPILILLGAMIPVGMALETTGGATLLADLILRGATVLSPPVMLVLILVGTMFLSDIVNNAAAALLMAPIALQVAAGLGVSADPFLLAVAIGASCAFLTPIGHQSNTLVMGPGGYQFGDYWRMGLALEVLITVVSVPLLLFFWPL